MLPLLLLAACTPTSLTIGGEEERPDRDPADTDGRDTDPRDTDPRDTDDTDTVEHIGDTGPDDTDDTAPEDTGPGDEVVFNLDAVHLIDIALAPGGRASLDRDPYTYVPADVTFDGETFPNVGIRIKGRLGSLRTLSSKAALKLDLLEFGETEKLHGLEKLNLNNMVQDCAKVKELAAYAIHRATGTPAPRVAYAEITIDGTFYGLYSVVEDYDDEFLQDHFEDPTGNLYDGDYYLWPDGNYTLLDFSAATESWFDLDEGVDVGLADIHAVTQALASAGGGLDGVGEVVDIEQHAAFLAVSAWTGHYDSYSYYSNNYRVYFDPARGGRAVILPWDPDWAFYAPTQVASPYTLLSQACLRDADCRAGVVATIDTLDATVPGGPVEDDVNAAIALIGEALGRDPMLEQAGREIRQCQADLPAWFARRGAEMDAAGL